MSGTGGPAHDDEWAGPSANTTVVRLRRLGKHLIRDSARGAWIMALGSALVAAWVGPQSGPGQVLLVLVGIAVSVAVLPESPHRLWNVTAKDLADTVPSPELAAASKEIAGALALQSARLGGLVPDDVVRAFWDGDLDAFGRVLAEPALVIRNVDYRVRVTPSPAGPPVVSVSLDAERCIPHAQDGRVWFSFCSNPEALRAEFLQHANGCIGRELIDIVPGESDEAWLRRVKGYAVNLFIDGEQAERVDDEGKSRSGDRDWLVHRVAFAARDLTERFVATKLTMQFHADAGQRRFPVKFAAYWVEGATTVSFEVDDPTAVVGCDEYFAAVNREVTIEPLDESLTSRGWNVLTGAGTVLAPGSGALFSWEDAPSASPLPPAQQPLPPPSGD